MILLPAAVAVILLAALASEGGLRFISGRPMDGKRRTDATFLQPPTKGLHPTAARSWWHWRPGWHRAAIRVGAVTVAVLVAVGLIAARGFTVACLAALLAAAAAYAVLRVARGAYRWGRAVAWDREHPWKSAGAAVALPWRHYWHYRRPLRYALTGELGVPPARLRIPFDRSGVTVGLPPEFTGADKKTEAVTRAVAAKLALEAPDIAPRLHGRRPQLRYTLSDPPPKRVTWEDLADAVRGAAANELVFGIGKRDAIVKASYGDSPHLAIPGGSGGGKSNLAAFLLLQELMRGSLIFNLDPKWISHLWLQNLPNVINAHDIPDLHLALTWLGRELLRRTKAVYYSAEGTGRVRGTPGRRIIVLCEELNYGMPGLKDYWRETRTKDDAKRSPAIAGLEALSCAGRASDMREWLIAQMLTVASTGVSDSTIRGNAGTKAMVRWDPPGWAMAVGKHIPMPLQNTTPGRIQLVTGGEPPRETQVPYLHLDDKDPDVADRAVTWARKLAVSGAVAQIPGGPEGVPPQLWPASVLGHERPSLTAAQEPETGKTVLPVAPSLTLAEAVEAGVFGERGLGAVRKRVQRAGLEPDGQRGDGSYTYDRAALFAAARDRRKELAS